MIKKVTIKDVAKESGVSISTVSQILNGRTKHFNKDTISRVLAVKEHLNYEADYFARRMIVKKSRTIGILVPSISNPYFATLLEGIENVLFKERYVPIFSVVNRQNQREVNTLDELMHRGVDGFIIASDAISDQVIQEKLTNRYPYIVLDQKQSAHSLDVIATDDYQGGKLAAQHLQELNHQSVAVLAPKIMTGNIEQRVIGFTENFTGEICHLEAELTKDAGVAASNKIIESTATGIFTVSDEIAFGLYLGLSKFNKKIPTDYSLIGYDNTEMGEYVTPTLTTINQPACQLGQITAKRLLDRINEPDKELTLTKLPVNLIKRHSTAHLK
ncbi:LacI family transcriptional regulator [Vagococcus penaei]|uniref:LacI family transcriptional regulator n=1 Tax=Vagococcus penaei TaxID=633807 RepID=A0A1Q2D509_9ENTE|nr:LacI family DNA-binding transcriptional regulator [Vagococcus penaei]AQP53365.1 LacI family transcriptional regulator [Vagococcus penaei]RST99688.1 LacI family transcriptional regulator [Vagococcus penaei]